MNVRPGKDTTELKLSWRKRGTICIFFLVSIGFLLNQILILGSFQFTKKTAVPPTRVAVEEPVLLFSSVDQLDKERVILDQLNKERAWVPEEQAVRIRFEAFAGLGHRLVRQSNAFHLSKALNLTRLSVDWLTCKGAPMFDHLFGKGPLVVPSPTQPLFPFLHSTDGRLGRRDAAGTVVFKNEVDHYTNRIMHRDKKALHNMTPPFYGKVQSDVEMYRQLLTLFRFRDRVQTFRQANNVSDHTLLGLHVRAGNGEQGDFNEKGRAFSDLDRWISNILRG